MDDFNDKRACGFPTETLAIGQGRERVDLSLRRQGRDWILTLGGGDTHVGAVAVAARESLIDKEPCESLMVVPGHKEGPMALAAARRLAEASGQTCVCIAGIHQDEATTAEIQAIVANAERGLELLIRKHWS